MDYGLSHECTKLCAQQESLNKIPAVEYRVPGYSRVSLRASLVEWRDVPVTIIFDTPIKLFNKIY